MKIIKKLTFWIDNARYNALPQSLLPAIVAVFAASQQNTFSLFYALLAVMGIIFAHLSMNLLDDYFDYKNKGTTIRNQLAAGGIRSRIAKCEYLTSGQASVKQLLTASALFALLALFFGTFILIKQGIGILYITLITTFFGISYSGIPFKFSYHGMGELVIGLIFGPLLMSGVFYASCGMLSPFIFFISVPVGLLVANILFTHSIMDMEPDKRANKITLAVLFNNMKINLFLAFCFIFLPFIIMITGIECHFLSRWFYLVLLSLPNAIHLFYLMIQFAKYPQKKLTPKWWMQPMERWNEITKIGIDWFMIRWYSSRNLILFFCLWIIIALFISKGV